MVCFRTSFQEAWIGYSLMILFCLQWWPAPVFYEDREFSLAALHKCYTILKTCFVPLRGVKVLKNDKNLIFLIFSVWTCIQWLSTPLEAQGYVLSIWIICAWQNHSSAQGNKLQPVLSLSPKWVFQYMCPFSTVIIVIIVIEISQYTIESWRVLCRIERLVHNM